jgi:hypothetical protein
MAEQYTDAIREGLATEKVPLPGADGYDYSTPDYKMLESLEKSAYRFSAAKSWQVNKALTELLKEGTHTVSFAQFQKAAAQRLDVYIGQYGRVEYTSAVSSAQMSAKWSRFQADAADMPYLQFKTSKSDRVCPICAPYDNMIRKVNDPVWEHASPLLHYYCYCTILQLPHSHATITPDADLPDPAMIPAIFRTNYARKMQAFSPDHPYYDEVPKKSITAWVKDNYVKPRNK